MKRISASLISGACLTMLVFALHLLIQRYFSWHDKPMMPHAFTYLLLPGYRIGTYVAVSPFFQFAIAALVDCFLFSMVVWLALMLVRIAHAGTARQCQLSP
jgi:hypothetical protein